MDSCYGSGDDYCAHDAILLLQRIIHSEELLKKITKSSSAHPNGFLKINLLSWPSGENLRIHVWPQGPCESNIHTHRWSMRCMLLLGGYETHYFHESDPMNPTGFKAEKYACSANLHGHHMLERVQCVSLERINIHSAFAGRYYDMEAEECHQIRKLNSDKVISLVACEATRAGRSFVYAAKGRPLEALGSTGCEIKDVLSGLQENFSEPRTLCSPYGKYPVSKKDLVG